MKLWIARDKNGLLTIYNKKPELYNGEYWDGDYDTQVIDIPKKMFPEVTFENSPKEVEIKLVNDMVAEDLLTNCIPLESEFSKFIDDNFDELI